MIQSEVKVGSVLVIVGRCFIKETSSPAACGLFMRALRLTQRLELSYAEGWDGNGKVQKASETA